ncbi:MAG: hypothetical protein GTO22_05915, partial [Gemmatimonadales bacterium]|nr:hypothetical protein [Gemmatimonadales bacterium]
MRMPTANRHRPFLVLAVAIGVFFVVLSSMPWAGSSDVRAQTGVDIGIDMDVTGNDARLTGGADIQDCGEIDSAGTNSVELDVILPPPGVDANGVKSYVFELLYDPAVVEVISKDIFFLLAQAEGSDLLLVADPRIGDGVFKNGALEVGSPPGPEPAGVSEVGPGVLARITLTGVAPGLSYLDLVNINLWDFSSNPIPIDNVFNAIVAVDEQGFCDVGPPTPTPTPIDEPPEASDDTATTDEDVSVTIDVLANDLDPEGNALTVADVMDPTNGSVAVNTDETVSYTPDADFNGTDSFTYKANDGTADSNIATVTITVNP